MLDDLREDFVGMSGMIPVESAIVTWAVTWV